jgi:hypothetical protein
MRHKVRGRALRGAGGELHPAVGILLAGVPSTIGSLVSYDSKLTSMLTRQPRTWAGRYAGTIGASLGLGLSAIFAFSGPRTRMAGYVGLALSALDLIAGLVTLGLTSAALAQAGGIPMAGMGQAPGTLPLTPPDWGNRFPDDGVFTPETYEMVGLGQDASEFGPPFDGLSLAGYIPADVM